MNKAKVIFIAVALFLIPNIGICESDGWTTNLKVYLGEKYLDRDDWKPLEDPFGIGFLLDFGPKKWPVNIAIDYLDSRTEENQFISGRSIKVDGGTTEINIGVRKIFEISPTIRPYIGGGVAYIHGEFKTSEYFINQGFITTSDDSDTGIGIWLNVGVYWIFDEISGWFSIPEHVSLGIDLRYSKAEITLFGEDIEAGGLHAGFTAGFHW